MILFLNSGTGSLPTSPALPANIEIITLVFLLIEWFLISFARAQFVFPQNFWRYLWVSVFFGMVVSPFFFYLILKLSKLSGCSVVVPAVNPTTFAVTPLVAPVIKIGVSSLKY